MKVDGHVHTNFCPHGTDAPMEEYVRRAIEKGLDRLTFTEHAPLPEGFADPVPEKDSAMRAEDVPAYLEEGQRLAEKYRNKILIHTGFEVDFIEGFEDGTRAFLKAHRETVPHSILSVHFVQLPDGYYCIDYSADHFEAKAAEIGADALYRAYERTIRLAAARPFGTLTPDVIGHVNLIHKFKKRVSAGTDVDWEAVLRIAAGHNRVLDYNFAGKDKPDYGKPYPDASIIELAELFELPLQTGSDAHDPKDVGRYFT